MKNIKFYHEFIYSESPNENTDKNCILQDSPFNLTLSQNVMPFCEFFDFTMKFRYSLIIIEPQIDEKHHILPRIHLFWQLQMKIWTKSCIPWDSPFNLTLYQNVMSFCQFFDFTMKFRYSLIIIKPQIDEKHHILPWIHPFRQLQMKIQTKSCIPRDSPFNLTLYQNVMSFVNFLISRWSLGTVW